MHIDIREPQYEGRTFRVFLNGEEISNKCFVADSARSYVDCYLHDENGKLMTAAQAAGCNKPELLGNASPYKVATERLYGDVMIYEDLEIDEIIRRGVEK